MPTSIYTTAQLAQYMDQVYLESLSAAPLPPPKTPGHSLYEARKAMRPSSWGLDRPWETMGPFTRQQWEDHANSESGIDEMTGYLQEGYKEGQPPPKKKIRIINRNGEMHEC
jgi:hypothetical protein